MASPRLAGITRPVWTLSVVSFLADLSGEMVYPIIPLFLTVTLGAPVVAVGVVEGVAEGVANVTKLVSGGWSDAVARRKPFVVAGYALGAAGKAVLAVAPAWGLAVVGRSIDRFGKGVRTAPRDALLADFSEDRYRGRVFGLHRSMDTLGAVCGPLLGLALLQLLDERLRLIILIAVVPGILSVLVLRWLPEHKPDPKPASQPAGRAELPVAFYLLLGTTVVFMLGNSSDAFLILRSKDLGLSTTLVVLAYVAYNVVYAAMSLPAGIVSDRVPRGVLLLAGYLIFGGVYLGFAAVDSETAVWPLFAVYGAYIALTDGVSKALVADLAPKSARSSALGIYQGSAGLAALVASVTAGLLWDQVSVRAPFFLGAGASGLAALGMFALLATGTLRRQPA
jgi:MFS family permease